MKTEEQIFYKKVYIHSEDDLPKSNGLYVIWNNTAKTILNNVLFDSSSNCKSYWMEYIGWYLLPVTLPGDEEVNEILDAKKPYKTERYEGEKYDSETYFVLSDDEKYSIKLFYVWLKSLLTDK